MWFIIVFKQIRWLSSGFPPTHLPLWLPEGISELYKIKISFLKIYTMVWIVWWNKGYIEPVESLVTFIYFVALRCMREGGRESIITIVHFSCPLLLVDTYYIKSNFSDEFSPPSYHKWHLLCSGPSEKSQMFSFTNNLETRGGLDSKNGCSSYKNGRFVIVRVCIHQQCICFRKLSFSKWSINSVPRVFVLKIISPNTCDRASTWSTTSVFSGTAYAAAAVRRCPLTTFDDRRPPILLL